MTFACGAPPNEPRDGGTTGIDSSSEEQCTRNSECEDSLFCTTWRCVPGAAGADARGCIEVGPPCTLGESCVEDESRCVADACGAVTDGDGDGHDSLACGGDDCDDDDPGRYAGNPEICDDAGHDEDCDATTIMGTSDGDVDGDGAIARTCCNGAAACGTDCDDGDRAIHPGARELCNARDDDCDGVIDEAGGEGICPGGTCIGGRCNLPAWDRVMGGTGGFDIVWDVIMDERGRVFAGGSFGGEASFGGAGTPEVATGTASAFIAAYEPDGAYSWFRSIGGPGIDLVYRLAHARGTDRIYAFIRVGSAGPADLGGGLRDPGAYVVAFDARGVYQWDRELPSMEAIEATADGGVLVAGILAPGFDLGGGPRTPTRATAAYLASYASDGTHRWDRLIEADASARIRGLAYAGGRIAATGSFGGSADFGEGRALPGSGPDGSSADVFVLTLADGIAPTIGTLYSASGSGASQGLHVAFSSDRIHFCGYLTRTEDLGLGPITGPLSSYFGFIVAIDTSGAPIAQRTWSTSLQEGCAGVAVDASEHLFVAGTFSGSADFGGGTRTAGPLSAFFARYNADLSHRSDGILISTGGLELRGADIGPADSTVIGGNMYGTADLGSGPRTSAGSSDGFIVRFAN